MKRLVAGAVAAVLSVGAHAIAQNSRTVGQQVQLAGGVITVDAGRTELMGNGTAFSGAVVISVNGIRITADRATVEVNDVGEPRPPADIRLEGNVRLSVLKQP